MKEIPEPCKLEFNETYIHTLQVACTFQEIGQLENVKSMFE